MKHKNIVNQIPAADTHGVYIAVTEVACEWAVAGFIDEANLLLERLWSYNLSHERDCWVNVQGFQFLWKETAKYPGNIPFKLGDTEKIEMT